MALLSHTGHRRQAQGRPSRGGPRSEGGSRSGVSVIRGWVRHGRGSECVVLLPEMYRRPIPGGVCHEENGDFKKFVF